MGKERELLAYCGLYCGDCGGYSGEIANTAINLLKILEKYKFERTAKCLFSEKLKKYDSLIDMLQFLTTIKCEEICRNRKDSETSCKVRRCCREKGFYACYECDMYDKCTILRETNQEDLYGNSYLKNFQAIKEMGLDEWLKKGKRYWFSSEID
jgi:hypothetical protein